MGMRRMATSYCKRLTQSDPGHRGVGHITFASPSSNRSSQDIGGRLELGGDDRPWVVGGDTRLYLVAISSFLVLEGDNLDNLFSDILVSISFLVVEGDNLDKLFLGAGVELVAASSYSARWRPLSCCLPRGSRTSPCSPTYVSAAGRAPRVASAVRAEGVVDLGRRCRDWVPPDQQHPQPRSASTSSASPATPST
ncbi:hypothetical protein EJB05_56179, partial [Eragrostis curvula]